MDKLSGTAKKLDLFFKILFWLTIGLTAMAVVILAVTFFSPDESVANFTLTINGISVAAPQSAPADRRIVVVFGAAMLIAAAVICYGIHVVRNILGPMKKGLPFAPNVSAELRKLGWMTLAGGIVYAVFDLASKVFFVNLLEMSALTNANVSVTHSLNGTFLLVAAILFLFSYIFRYGAALQQQADETL